MHKFPPLEDDTYYNEPIKINTEMVGPYYQRLAKLIALGLSSADSIFTIFLKKGIYDPRILKHIEAQFEDTEMKIIYIQSIKEGIMLWKHLRAGNALRLCEHQTAILSLYCSDFLYSFGNPDTVYRWDIDKLDFVEKKRYPGIGIQCSTNTDRVIIEHWGKGIIKIIGGPTINTDKHIYSVCLSPNGKELCYCCGKAVQENILVCNLEDLTTYEISHKFYTTYMSYSPDGKYIAMVCAYCVNIHIWDTQAKQFMPGYNCSDVFEKENSSYEKVIYSPDGQYIYYNFAGEGGVYIGKLNIATKQTEILPLPTNTEVISLDPSGKYLVTAQTYECEFNIYHIESQKNLVIKTSDYVRDVCFSPDGQLIFIAEDCNILVYYFPKLIEGAFV